jgi:uncharacterized protein YndB with AHSA1/START domain
MTNVTVTHRFLAAAERVYDAWLDPEKVRTFLYATATGEIVRCDVDARVGGRYTIVDRRNGEDVVHEGTYLELERPSRIVFTLRVPKYSSGEDRVPVDIARLAHGCELRLSAPTADERADDARRGWATILDVLDEALPAEAATCGSGLAQHAAVPRRIAIYLDELAETLELHRAMLVLDDPKSQDEDAVYRDLATRYRDIAASLRPAADRMSAQRDLPMGTHDERKWTDKHMKAFARFVSEQGALASLLHVAAARDEQILVAMQKKSA